MLSADRNCCALDRAGMLSALSPVIANGVAGRAGLLCEPEFHRWKSLSITTASRQRTNAFSARSGAAKVIRWTRWL